MFFKPGILILGVFIISQNNKKPKNHSFGICAHHRKGHIDYYTHTLCIRIREKEIRLCARCSGIYSGFIVSIIIEAIFGFWLFGKILDPVKSLISAIILSLPLLIDWGTQKVGLRESNNYLRVITGILFGVGLSMIQFTADIFFWTMVVMLCYALIMLLLIKIGNKRKKFSN